MQQPAGATIGAGGTANLTVVVSGAAPLGYQWELEGTNLAGATASSLRLSNVTRRSSGVYAVAVSNPVESIVSSNATVEVLVPQKLEIPVWGPNGAFTALSRDVDGGVLELGDLPGFEARASTNLVDWTTLTNSLLLTNGSLLLLDPEPATIRVGFTAFANGFPLPEWPVCNNQIGRHFPHTGAEVQVRHGELEHFEGGLVQGAIRLGFAAAHAGVACNMGPLLEPLLLALAGRDDALPDLGRGLAGAFASRFAGLLNLCSFRSRTIARPSAGPGEGAAEGRGPGSRLAPAGGVSVWRMMWLPSW